jgi:F0F1-type ATP synthase delta subunit
MNHDTDPNTTPPPEFEQHADVGAERLARVYAEALLAVADQDGQTREVLGEIDSLLDDVLKRDGRLAALFSGAAIGRNARRALLEKAFADRAGAIVYKFLMVLNEHERLDLLGPIRRALHDLDDERHHRVKVHVFTAVPLPDGYGGRIAEGVRRRFGLEPVLIPHVALGRHEDSHRRPAARRHRAHPPGQPQEPDPCEKQS